MATPLLLCKYRGLGGRTRDPRVLQPHLAHKLVVVGHDSSGQVVLHALARLQDARKLDIGVRCDHLRGESGGMSGASGEGAGRRRYACDIKRATAGTPHRQTAGCALTEDARHLPSREIKQRTCSGPKTSVVTSSKFFLDSILLSGTNTAVGSMAPYLSGMECPTAPHRDARTQKPGDAALGARAAQLGRGTIGERGRETTNVRTHCKDSHYRKSLPQATDPKVCRPRATSRPRFPEGP
jgi:hypothetical protein